MACFFLAMTLFPEVQRKAQEEIDAVRISQQTQQLALLEELNSVQTENTNLRAQLRKK